VENIEKRMAAGFLGMSEFDRQTENRRLFVMKQMALDRIREIKESKLALEVEYHKKFALSFAVIIFILIGVPLGMMTRTSGIGMAFSFSSIIFLIYYIALNGGEQLADKGQISPFISMWISNIVFFILAILLIIASIREKRLLDVQVIMWKIKHLRQRKKPLPDEVLY
jgi:lipopolysaccharide export system permease protein